MFNKEKTFDEIMSVFTKSATDLGKLINSKNNAIEASKSVIDEHTHQINVHNLVISQAQSALSKISEILGKN